MINDEWEKEGYFTFVKDNININNKIEIFESLMRKRERIKKPQKTEERNTLQ